MMPASIAFATASASLPWLRAAPPPRLRLSRRPRRSTARVAFTVRLSHESSSHTQCNHNNNNDTEFQRIAPIVTPGVEMEETPDISASLDVGAGGSDSGSGDYSRGGGGGRGDGEGKGENNEDSEDSELSALLSQKNATVADIPAPVMSAYRSGVIPLWAVSNYLVARSNPISRLMLLAPPLRDRFLADKLFLLKILIEEGIGIGGKLTAEYQQRRSNFWREGEFVLANVIMALLADFALVYFPAPSLSLTSSATSGATTNWLGRLSSSLPSNIFQTDRPFTLAQRAGGFVFKSAQLFTVGFLCCFSGVVITNALMDLRQRVDPSYEPQTAKQNPLLMSVFYGTFLGLSSGSRYQLINGIENAIFPKVFASTAPIVEQSATFALRYANTFWGSQQWVMFARFTNLQKRNEQVEQGTFEGKDEGERTVN